MPMRKLILTLPVIAIMLAAGLLLSEVRGAFASPVTNVAVAPTTTGAVQAASSPKEPTPDWNETKKAIRKPKKSSHQP